jgi:phosphoribosylformimino-5-aminoimidazole carboxamide ribonucleotide (ProFAR) isomerase
LEAEIILNQKDINLTEEYRNIYRQLVRPEKRKRRFIATIDMHNGKPALVKSSEVFDSHSNGDVEEAFSKLTRYFDEVLMVDLNGSMKDSKEGSQANRDLIKKCNSKYRVMAGGGIHTIADVEELLSAGVKKIVVGSNTSKEFLDQIPKDRLIVELSINDEFEVLIEGRKVNTKVKAITKVL